jgi:hypothetical protein
VTAQLVRTTKIHLKQRRFNWGSLAICGKRGSFEGRSRQAEADISRVSDTTIFAASAVAKHKALDTPAGRVLRPSPGLECSST